MKCLIFNKQEILCNNKIIDLDTLLVKRKQLKEVFLICGPGNYTQTRINICIGKALKIYGIKVYGINLLLDFCNLFFKKNICKVGNFFFVFNGYNMFLEKSVENGYDDYGQNFNKFANKYIDTSIENIFQYLDKITLKEPYQFYIDKFQNNN